MGIAIMCFPACMPKRLPLRLNVSKKEERWVFSGNHWGNFTPRAGLQREAVLSNHRTKPGLLFICNAFVEVILNPWGHGMFYWTSSSEHLQHIKQYSMVTGHKMQNSRTLPREIRLLESLYSELNESAWEVH